MLGEGAGVSEEHAGVGLVASEVAAGEHPLVNGRVRHISTGTLCADPGARLSVSASERRIFILFDFLEILNCAESCLIHRKILENDKIMKIFA